jgi:hypothetical protein
VDYAELRKWLVFHVRDARKLRMVGWPDLFCLRDGRAVALELKAQNGRLTATQSDVLRVLAGVPGITAMVARPSDWDDVMRVLA